MFDILGVMNSDDDADPKKSMRSATKINKKEEIARKR